MLKFNEIKVLSKIDDMLNEKIHHPIFHQKMLTVLKELITDKNTCHLDPYANELLDSYLLSKTWHDDRVLDIYDDIDGIFRERASNN